MLVPMHEMEIFSAGAAALTAAMLGSVHCLAMCGPLRLLTGADRKSRILYQGGRAAAYALLGAGAGALGSTLPLSALVVFVVVAGALALGSFRFGTRFPMVARLRRLVAGHPLLLGLSSGLLPCGLLHGWVVAAAATASAGRGALLLGALWVGSLPALEIAPTLLSAPLRRVKASYPRLIVFVAILLAAAPAAWRVRMTYAPPGAAEHACHSAALPQP